MKLVIISDTHGMHGNVEVPPGDVLIHCGDFTKYGRMDEVKKFASWLGAQPHTYKLATAGNHDKAVEVDPEKAKGYFNERENEHLLLNEGVEIAGVKFWASPITPEFFNWHFMRERGEDISTVWSQIPDDTDVLITHGPPFGVGDLCPPYHTSFRKHAGCIDLLNRVRVVKPKLHCFGHIHDGHGVTEADELRTVFVNASTCTEEYKPTNPTIGIEIGDSGCYQS